MQIMGTKVKKLILIILFPFMLYAQISRILIGNKTSAVAVAVTYEFFITSDSDTFFLSDGDTLKVRISYIEFKQLEINNENNIIAGNRLYAVLRKRTGTA